MWYILELARETITECTGESNMPRKIPLYYRLYDFLSKFQWCFCVFLGKGCRGTPFVTRRFTQGKRSWTWVKWVGDKRGSLAILYVNFWYWFFVFYEWQFCIYKINRYRQTSDIVVCVCSYRRRETILSQPIPIIPFGNPDVSRWYRNSLHLNVFR